MNGDAALRHSQNSAKSGLETGEGKPNKKNMSEKARRDLERYHLERISALFRVYRQPWAKKEVLSFGEAIFLIDGGNRLLTEFIPAVLFLVYGSEPFPRDFIAVRPIAPGL